MRDLIKERPALTAFGCVGVVSLVLNVVQLAYLSTGGRLPLAVPIALTCVSLVFCGAAAWMAVRAGRGGSTSR